MADPKLGYHGIWLVPLLVLQMAVDRVRYMFNHIRSRWMEFRRPNLRRLKRLAGVDRQK